MNYRLPARDPWRTAGATLASVTTRAAVAALVLGLLSCGVSRKPSDGGSDSGDETSLGDDGGTSISTCDPAAPQCGEGMRCDFLCQEKDLLVACRAESPKAVAGGAACNAAMPCMAGYGCFGISPAASSPTCRRYCATDADCATGHCQMATITVDCGGRKTLRLPICY